MKIIMVAACKPVDNDWNDLKIVEARELSEASLEYQGDVQRLVNEKVMPRLWGVFPTKDTVAIRDMPQGAVLINMPDGQPMWIYWAEERGA